MLHVNNREGFTIAVSENKQLARIARSTVLSDDACSVMVPILHQVLGWSSSEIRARFESSGLTLQEWKKRGRIGSPSGPPAALLTQSRKRPTSAYAGGSGETSPKLEERWRAQ